MAMRARQILAGDASYIQRLAIGIETRGKESLLLVFAEQRIAPQFAVCRNPKHFLGWKLLPTVRTSDARSQLNFWRLYV